MNWMSSQAEIQSIFCWTITVWLEDELGNSQRAMQLSQGCNMFQQKNRDVAGGEWRPDVGHCLACH